MAQTAELEMQNITPTIELIYRGLPINEALAASVDQQVHKERRALAVRLCKEFKLPTLITDLFSPEEPAPDSYKALNNPKTLLALISKKLGQNFPSTQSALLERLLTVMEDLSTEGTFEYKDEEEEELYKELEHLENSVLVQGTELVRMVLDYRRLTKQIGFDLRQYQNPTTKRVHPSYNPLGTATGRFSSAKPNAQQISASLPLNVPININSFLPQR